MASPNPYDPRLGDEDDNEHEQERRHVQIEDKSFSRHSTLTNRFNEKLRSPPRRHNKSNYVGFWKTILQKLINNFHWMYDNWTWSKIKPTLRSALAAWISLMFVLISQTENELGQASFLILIVAFLDPPNEPFIDVLERELLLVLFVTIGWAWSCLALFLANLTRIQVVRNATTATIFTGQYVEAAPSVIMAVFMFVGTSAFLFIKARKGPGPYLYPCVFGCICIDISLTTGALFPYPFYRIGKAIALPISVHAAVSLILSVTFFPTTVTARYVIGLCSVLDPLGDVVAKHRQILKLAPDSDPFAEMISSIEVAIGKSEAGLAASSAKLRLLKRDIVWGRFSPIDVASLHPLVRNLFTRTNGLGEYFKLIEPTREKFPITPAPSRPVSPTSTRPSTPWGTPSHTRPSTPVHDESRTSVTDPIESRTRRRRHDPGHSVLRHSLSRHRHHDHPHAHFQHDNHIHFSLLQVAHALAPSHVPTSPSETAVGVFESQRYLAIESKRLSHKGSPESTALFTDLLGESCDELLAYCQPSLKGIREWVRGVRQGSFVGKKTLEKLRADRYDFLVKARDELNAAMVLFSKEKRHAVLDPYRSAFDPKHVGSAGAYIEPPPHRYLFHCYVYQYHLLQFATILIAMLDQIIQLEKDCAKAKLWYPSLPFHKFFTWYPEDSPPERDRDDDEDPDVIQGIPMNFNDADLGTTGSRDPDALPPTNLFQSCMHLIYRIFVGLTGGNAIFALKAGLLTIVLSIPSFIKDSAEFAYGQKFVWAIFMGQLTLARFRGDTTFGLVARIISTFLGCLVGMIMWYVSTGRGHGNPYGLAAVCAVCFPAFFYWRLHWPGPPMTNAIFFVTTILVVGYSWQDTHFPVGYYYWGFDMAWRRFVLVTVGVTAAFISSFSPPSTTLRHYQRRMMSTTVAEIGTVYCSIVSFANTRGTAGIDKGEINQSLVAIRMKLKRSLALKTNIIYEFSLRGKWPAERYHKILEIQLQIVYLLSHLMSVVEHLEPAWSRAFLRRTRLMDSDFQGDVLAVISMISTALRTGNPLPQITPCPLLDRFMIYAHGLNVIRNEADDDYGLPRTMTIDTLENEQYLCFSVGVTTAFGVIMRLDRLMVATKELVGEQYHIHGIGLEMPGDMRPNKEV